MRKSKAELEEEILSLWKQFLEYDNERSELPKELEVSNLLIENNVSFECHTEAIWHDTSIVTFLVDLDVHEAIHDIVIDGLRKLKVDYNWNDGQTTVIIKVKVLKK